MTKAASRVWALSLGHPRGPAGCTELLGSLAQETQTPSSWGSQPSPGTFPGAGAGAQQSLWL